jgi:hypothetical protein
MEQWASEKCYDERDWLYEFHIATRAAQWGADQELEACCALMDDWGLEASDLRAARRPKPPSLKEQALAELEILSDFASGLGCDGSAIRRVLEQLND